jgi:hypothetical protein
MGDAGYPMPPGEFADLLRRVEETMRRAENEVRRLVDTARDALDWLGPLANGVRDVLARTWELFLRLREEMIKFCAQPGVPWTLWSHGSDWSGEPIGGRVSRLISKATLDEARVDDHWQGPAADAYRNTLARQKDALAMIKSTADVIDDVLAKVAVAIGGLWLAMLAGIVTFVLEVIALIAAASTGVGAPPAAGGGLAAVVKVLGWVSAAAGAFYAFVGNEALGAAKDLHQQLNNGAAYPDGHWPRSTVDMSDGSLSDGDATDWRLRYA